MPKTTNYEHLLSLGVHRMAGTIWNLCSDYCLFCPRNMNRTCNEDCAAGIAEWLRAPYIPESDVWKEIRT